MYEIRSWRDTLRVIHIYNSPLKNQESLLFYDDLFWLSSPFFCIYDPLCWIMDCKLCQLTKPGFSLIKTLYTISINGLILLFIVHRMNTHLIRYHIDFDVIHKSALPALVIIIYNLQYNLSFYDYLTYLKSEH